MIKVSVLCPVYNSEKYLEDCLNSILNQTFKDFELIIIDDCSTDNSKKIVEKFLKEDSRIKLIENKENLSYGISLNKALDSGSSTVSDADQPIGHRRAYRTHRPSTCRNRPSSY